MYCSVFSPLHPAISNHGDLPSTRPSLITLASLGAFISSDIAVLSEATCILYLTVLVVLCLTARTPAALRVDFPDLLVVSGRKVNVIPMTLPWAEIGFLHTKGQRPPPPTSCTSVSDEAPGYRVFDSVPSDVQVRPLQSVGTTERI